MSQGPQGIRLFEEHKSTLSMKCNRIIHKSKVRNVSIIFINDNVIDPFSLYHLQWIESPNIYLFIYFESTNIYEAGTIYWSLGLELRIRVNKN